MKDWIIILLLVALSTIFLLDRCDNAIDDHSHLKDMESAAKFAEGEKSQRIKDSNLIVQERKIMEQNLMTEKAAKELLHKELEDYKRVNSFIKGELITALNDLRAEFSSHPGPEIPPSIVSGDSTIHIDSVRKYFTRVPRDFYLSDGTWYSISGLVDKKGVLFDSLSFINKFDITVGYKKGKRFWNKSTPVVDLKSYNPYTKAPYVNNITIKSEKVPWYYTRPAFFVYGVLAEFGFSKLKTN